MYISEPKLDVPCTDPDTPYILPGLEETDDNYKRHVDFDEDPSIPLIVDIATAGLQILACFDGKPPNKRSVFDAKKL